MRRKKFSNKKAENFIAKIPVLTMDTCDLVSRSKFNFSYMDLGQPEKLADDLTLDFFNEILEKLKHYSTHPLSYWINQPIGRKSGKVLEVYTKFPIRTDFEHPKSVPNDAVWCRFRVSGSVRLAGFIVPSALNNQLCKQEKYRFCVNTFYVVFIDMHHRFYITNGS